MSTPSDASAAAASRTFDESIDGRVFDMVSSTASAVSTTHPSRFHYSEDRGVIWGHYTGDTVSVGRMIGRRAGDVLHVSFVHLGVDGSTTAGSATSVVSRTDEGVLELTEDFVGPDGADHVSVCREVRA